MQKQDNLAHLLYITIVADSLFVKIVVRYGIKKKLSNKRENLNLRGRQLKLHNCEDARFLFNKQVSKFLLF